MRIKFDLNKDEVKALSTYAHRNGLSFYRAIRVVFHKGLDLPLDKEVEPHGE